MKRYAIVEVPDCAVDMTMRFYGTNCTYLGAETIEADEMLKGPVALMGAACTEAGVRLRIPKIGDWVMYGDGTWHKVVVESDDWDIRPVIPAPAPATVPEPEKPSWKVWAETDGEPCPHCQGIGGAAPLMATITDTGWTCMKCGRPESEWTYAHDPEPKKPCLNCQGNKPWDDIVSYKYGLYSPWVCVVCERPESEWTFTTDPGGIGGGGTGGPL